MKLDKSYKVRVTPEQSREIQELVFKLGGNLQSGDTFVKETHLERLYVSKYLEISFGLTAHGWGYQEGATIQADDLIALLTNLSKSAENPLQDMKLTPEFESLPDGLKSSQTPITSFSFIDVLKKSASSILTQDNLGTANPAYCVKERTRHFGIDDNYQNDGYEWFCSEQQEGFDCDCDMHDALNTIAEYTGEDEVNMNGDTYQKCYYRDEERTVTTCFTREHAQDYIDGNRHNLKNPFIYVESFNRNPEMLAVRELLICLAENPTMFDGVTVVEGALDE